jgi:hypothetical protein
MPGGGGRRVTVTVAPCRETFEVPRRRIGGGGRITAEPATTATSWMVQRKNCTFARAFARRGQWHTLCTHEGYIQGDKPQECPMTSQRPFPIVAAIDFSELGDRAVLEALRLSKTHPRSELHVLTVGSEDSGAVRLPGSTLRVLPQESAEEETREHVADLVRRYTANNGPLDIPPNVSSRWRRRSTRTSSCSAPMDAPGSNASCWVRSPKKSCAAHRAPSTSSAPATSSMGKRCPLFNHRSNPASTRCATSSLAPPITT